MAMRLFANTIKMARLDRTPGETIIPEIWDGEVVITPRKQVVLGRLKNDLFFLTMLQGSNLCGSFLRKIFIND